MEDRTDPSESGTGIENDESEGDAFVRHASYIADVTPVTERQAEVFYRWYLADDSVPQHELAEEMGVTKGTFSKQLGQAKSVLMEGEIEGLKTMLATTPLGGVAGRTDPVVGVTETMNGFALLARSAFRSEETHSSGYTLHLVYREQPSEDIIEDIPDDVVLCDKWSTVSMHGNSPDHLGRTVGYYVGKLDEFETADEFAIYSLIADTLIGEQERLEEFKKESALDLA